MTFAIEVGGRTRNVDVRGSDIRLDGRRVYVDAVRAGHAWSLLVEPAGPAGPPSRRGGGGRSYEVAVVERAAGGLMVHVNGCPVVLAWSHGGPQGPALREHGGPLGPAARTARRAGARGEVASIGPERVLAPMPGRIARVLVKVGDVVAARQGLVVVEAMKMENELRSTRAGTVTEVPAVEGALVKAGAVLVVVR